MGLRASGKTTIAAEAARRTGLPLIEIDALVATELGEASAGEAIRTFGIEAFRRAEAGVLARILADRSPKVISLGGGTPTAPGAAAMLRDSKRECDVIYLSASPATLERRLRTTNVAARPTLTGLGTIEEVTTLHAQRDPLYRELASRVIDVDSLDAQQATDAVLGES